MCSFRKYVSDTCYVPDSVTAAGEVISGNYILMEGWGGRINKSEVFKSSVGEYEEKRGRFWSAISGRKERQTSEERHI